MLNIKDKTTAEVQGGRGAGETLFPYSLLLTTYSRF